MSEFPVRLSVQAAAISVLLIATAGRIWAAEPGSSETSVGVAQVADPASKYDPQMS